MAKNGDVCEVNELKINNLKLEIKDVLESTVSKRNILISLSLLAFDIGCIAY